MRENVRGEEYLFLWLAITQKANKANGSQVSELKQRREQMMMLITEA